MKKNIFMLSFIILAACLGFASCSDDDEATSSLPELGSVVVNPSEVAAGDKVDITINFSKKGSYVKGKYSVAIKDVTSVSAEIGGSTTVYTMTIPIPETAEKGVHTVTVNPPAIMSAFAGKDPFIDASKMKPVSTTLTIK